MTGEQWFSPAAFEANRAFLTDPNVRRVRFEQFEAQLRRVLDQLAARGKPLILSETGFPSGVDFEQQQRWILPIHDQDAFGDAYAQFMALLRSVHQDANGGLEAVYIYEWMDNLSHEKIHTEDSPIHTCFGLVDHQGQPKFDLSRLLPPVE